MTFLATSSPTAPTAEFIGLVVLVLILLTRWLWDYNKNRREEAALHEPKANPPLHKEYVTRTEHERDFKILHDDITQGAASRKRMHGEIDKIAQEQAALRKVNESQTTELGHLRTEIRTVNSRLDEIPKRTIELLATTKKLHE